MRALQQDEAGFDMPLTPLIDIVFLLLIFFLVATTFATREVDHRIRLPEAAEAGAAESLPEVLVVNLRADGVVVVDGRITEADTLREKLGSWRAARPGGRVAIRADGGADYGGVARVLGLCHAVGVVDVDLPVRPAGD